jgi:hypothetical protein
MSGGFPATAARRSLTWWHGQIERVAPNRRVDRVGYRAIIGRRHAPDYERFHKRGDRRRLQVQHASALGLCTMRGDG